MTDSVEIKIDVIKARKALTLVYANLFAFSTFWLVFFTLPDQKGNGLIFPAMAVAFVVLWLFFFLIVAPWLCKAQANRLRYRLENNALHADSGLIFYKRATIPVSRITDITLAQGPLQRLFGVWLIKVQTAGTGQKNPEVVLFGVVDPEQTKTAILSYVNASKIAVTHDH